MEALFLLEGLALGSLLTAAALVDGFVFCEREPSRLPGVKGVAARVERERPRSPRHGPPALATGRELGGQSRTVHK